MQIGYMLTNQCNASCTHCDTSCGPFRRDHLDEASILRSMSEAALLSDDGPADFCFSGGEPLLDQPKLLRLLRHGQTLGARLSCVSNGYWASSGRRARLVLQSLREAGLQTLAISSSRYHQQFIPRERVERALNIGRELGLDCHLKLVYLQSEWEPKAEIIRWAEDLAGADCQFIPLLPHLREGAEVAEEEFPRPVAEPACRCPAANINVGERGQVYMCCTPGAFTDFYAIGDIRDDSMEAIQSRFQFGSLQQALRLRGPAGFLPDIHAAGESHRLRKSYAATCDLCTHIAADPVLADIARRSAQAEAQARMSGVLDAVQRAVAAVDSLGSQRPTVENSL